MIASLRRRHQRVWIALALVLPATILLAWRARRPVVVMDRLPAALQAEAGP